MVEKKHKNPQKNNIPFKYNPIWVEEYKMMRAELVDYMNKMHEVKNMMYIAVGSVMIFSVSNKLPFLCVLLPLLLILPTYKNAVNYWLCVRKASAYLVVFHESYEDCPFHWESRHNMYKKIKKDESFKKSTFVNIPSHLFSYYTCAGIVIIVYFLKLFSYIAEQINRNEITSVLEIRIDGISVLFYIIFGIGLIIFLFFFFVYMSGGKSSAEFITDFLLIKNREVQKEIGKCWKNGSCVEYDDDDEISKITEMLNRYL